MATPPHVGFVLERSLGHRTHADNLAQILEAEPRIDAELLEIPWDAVGVGARIPVFNSNWTVRSGLRARRGIRRMHRAKPLAGLFVHTQVPAVLARDWIRRIPTVVSLDATPLQYDELGSSYGHATGHRRLEALKWRANRVCFAPRQIVTWSEWAKQGVVDGYGIEPTKITVIPPGVRPEIWHRTDERGETAGPVRILFVGGDLERKGGDILLEAFNVLRDELAARRAPETPTVELHLVTSAEPRRSPGVTVHRGLTPNSPELIELYHRSEIFCLPSRGDCLPMVLSEAGAAELPLVATAIAGLPEIVKENETGLVVPRDDVAALVDALRVLVDHPDLRRRLGRAARQLVDRDFDAVQNTGRLVDLLLDVATNEQPST